MSVQSALGKLKRVKQGLQDPTPFISRVRPEWESLARETARTVLNANRPESVTPEEWSIQTEFTASLISTHLVKGDLLSQTGIMFYLGSRTETSFSDALASTLKNTITLQEIADYVAAGMRGDPMGKPDIDDRDTGKTPEEIAYVIARSLANGNADREKDIRDFIEQRMGGEAAALYPAILDAWIEVLSVRAPRDWKAYIRSLVKS